ncbi:MAG TPA: hypothetical protein VGR54_03090 [Nitrosopumilaceae archaeon]|nr:hypothetical protein [Nitrosopumilaceae archaeon]
MTKIFCLVLLFLVISTSYLYTNAFADSNSTKQIPMFSKTLRYDQSNTFHDKTKNFSFSPPQNWIILNVPTSIPSKALVVFSNDNHTGLATLAIFYKPISQQVVSVLGTFSDSDILSEISNELSYNGADSKTKVLQSGLQRYQDGIVIKAVSLSQYPNDTTNIQNEHLIFFLNDGREYTLLLTSKPHDFNQDQKYFEMSADTFYVAPNENSTQTKTSKIGPPIPEFGPFTGMIIVTSIIGVVIISKRFGFHFS